MYYGDSFVYQRRLASVQKINRHNAINVMHIQQLVLYFWNVLNRFHLCTYEHAFKCVAHMPHIISGPWVDGWSTYLPNFGQKCSKNIRSWASSIFGEDRKGTEK